MFTKSILATTLLLLAASPASQAAIIYSPTTGSLIASIFTDFATFDFYDVRGASGGLVNGVTTAFVSDPANGTDPNFNTQPFGNLTVNVFDSALTNAVQLIFSAASAQVNGTVLTLSGTGSSIANSDGSLNSLLGAVTADFNFLNSEPFGNATIIRYDLARISSDPAAVPEPATFLLIGLALPFAGILRRRKRADNI